jgi:recombination protein RecR
VGIELISMAQSSRPMSALPPSVQKLIEEFERLPGVGPKSAARMAYHFLRAPKEQAEKLAVRLKDVKESIIVCESCFNFTEESPCGICSDSRRNRNLIMVVEEPLDVVAMDKISSKDGDGYQGVFHVLGGVISPVNAIGPEDLRIAELLSRLSLLEGEAEVIIATNPNLEGEATGMYLKEEISKLISKPPGRERGQSLNVLVTRIARGLPTGADLEYADQTTLRRAFEGRNEM